MSRYEHRELGAVAAAIRAKDTPDEARAALDKALSMAVASDCADVKRALDFNARLATELRGGKLWEARS